MVEERSGWPSLSLQVLGTHVASWDSFTFRLGKRQKEGQHKSREVFYSSSHQVLLWLNNKCHSSLPPCPFTHAFLCSVSSACVAWSRQSAGMMHRYWSHNAAVLFYRNTLQNSGFVMTPQTTPATCLPITDRHACLLIAVQLALEQRVLVESPWSALFVGCWCCCCATTEPIKRAN